MVWERCLAEGYTFLHSGRCLPDGGDVAMRVSGFCWMRRLLQHGDRVWEAISSRIVMARLKWIGKRQRSEMFMCLYCTHMHLLLEPPQE